jgi:hypothetical protein
MSAEWRLRRAVWDVLLLLKFRVAKPAVIPVPRSRKRPIRAVPLRQVQPSIEVDEILVADHVPSDEARPLVRVFYAFQVWLSRVFGPHMPGLPVVDADPEKRLRVAYGEAKRKLFRAPELPEAYRGREPDLGSLALAGPYVGYLTPCGEGRWEWDLRELSKFEHWPGLHQLGARVVFELEGERRLLEPVLIECELGEIEPQDERWPLARALALCSLTTHVSLVRHFNGIHLAIGAKAAIVTRNALPVQHPLFRLLWPHIYGSQFSNDIVTYGQMAPTGDFPMIFSYTSAGLYALYNETHKRIRLADYDPDAYAQRSGLRSAGVPTPGLDNLSDLYACFVDHARDYIRTYYESDRQLQDDRAVQAWLQELDGSIPNGVNLPSDQLTIEALARLIGLLIYVVVVEHELRGTFLWDYQMWTHLQPVRVYKNGQREPVDVYQRLVNANMLLNVSRAPLDRDFSYLAVDERGAEVFRAFRRNLQKLQQSLADSPRQRWKIYPELLNANMNA